MQHFEFIVPLSDGSRLVTKSVVTAKHQALDIARDTGKPCRVQVRNTVSGGGYDIEYFPSGEQQRLARRDA